MRVITNFGLGHFGLGFRYFNWDKGKHFIMLDFLWFSAGINIG